MEHKLFARHPIGNPRRKWRQDNVLLRVNPCPRGGKNNLQPQSELTHRKARRAVKTAFEAGFDSIGTGWMETNLALDVIRTTEQCGGQLIYTDFLRFGGMGDKNIFCEDNNFETILEETKKWNSVKGYCFWDEPILQEHMEAVRRMIDQCESLCPEMLPYTIANPDYHKLCRWQDNAYAPYIERFISTIDPVQMGFDYYPIGRLEYDPALQLDNTTMWSDLEIVRRAAQKHEIPFWFTYQGQRLTFHKIDYIFRFPMVRAMAYAGVLHGAKSLATYCSFGGHIDPTTGGKGVYFEDQKQLNHEIHALGNTLMALECLRVIHDDSLLPDHPSMEGIRTPFEESELLDNEKPLCTRISISEHKDAYGHKYLMVLNRDYDSPQLVRLKFKNPSHVYEVSKEDGEERFIFEDAPLMNLDFEPGELRLFRIQSAEETPYTLEYYLDK